MEFILILVVLGIIILGILKLFSHSWSKGLSACICFEDEHVNEGDVSTITEIVQNGKWLPLPALLVKFALDRSITYTLPENTAKSDFQYRNDCMVAMGYEKITRQFEVKFTKRGFYKITELQLTATDPFYYKPYAKKMDNQTSIYVYPITTRIRDLDASFERMSGEYINQRFLFEDPFEFKGIRAYEPTDPYKKINWGVSARTGDLMVNQYYDTNHLCVTILLDLEPDGMLYYEELMEESIRVARTYLERCIKQGIPVRLLTNATDVENNATIKIEKGAGIGHMDVCLRKLARIILKPEMPPFIPILEQDSAQSHGLSVLISVAQSNTLRDAFEDYVGTHGYGEWIIPVHSSSERLANSSRVRITYGEVIY